MTLVALRAAGAALLLDARGAGLPRIVHWGADPGESDLEALAEGLAPPVARAALDVPVVPALVPERASGWLGRPGLTGWRPDTGAPAAPSGETPAAASSGPGTASSGERPATSGGAASWTPVFALDGLERGDHGVVVRARDGDAGLTLRTELELTPEGVVRLRHALTNDGPGPYALQELGLTLPLPRPATEVLDLSGRWCRERHPQRRPLGQGTWLRETRHGRTGFDVPLLLAAGTPGFGFRSGELWAIHLGWSGDGAFWAQRLPSGDAALGAAELLGPGELTLAAGETYETPWLYAAWSDRGLDGVSAALHAYVRARPSHPRSPRPVVLNTWEAVYFDHRLERLDELATAAARLGVERFVLDDGWFRHRRDDSAGLGDWYVDEGVWPGGLYPLIERVRVLGMQFGLWVEPEMVNPDSDLFRAHPDWALGAPGRLPPPSRRQQVLDVANPAAFAYILGRLDALLGEYDIGYLKWDHNRDLTDSRVHAQTLAAYALLDALRRRHPGVEIESCSSGGARVDLGILARTDRVWASDTNDALERQAIQRWTQLLLPPELIGAHVGPPSAHTTGRTQDLSFRLATALFGHFGIEWDVTTATAAEQEQLAQAIAFYKRVRGLIGSGAVVRADHPDPSAALHGVVGAGEALFAFVQLTTSALELPGPVRLPGLDPGATYRVEAVPLAGGPATGHSAPPPWLDGGIELSGRALATAGLQLPVLGPEQALLLHLVA